MRTDQLALQLYTVRASLETDLPATLGRVADSGVDAVELRRMKKGDVFHVLPGTIHRMVAVTDVAVLEVSTPELDDVVRLEDVYGRQGTSEP